MYVKRYKATYTNNNGIKIIKTYKLPDMIIMLRKLFNVIENPL